MVYLTRRERFAAAHRLYRSQWTEEENEKVFGCCKNWHGHNYELYVTVKGIPNAIYKEPVAMLIE
jgi:6-pyruvoyltetrahydropterin/6-carboxytetrahydropterin synthase